MSYTTCWIILSRDSKYVGVFPLHELFQFASSGRSSGIAAAKENEREKYLAFIDGEAEGAIYIDDKGSLYSDKAVLMISGQEKFEFYNVKPDIVDAVVMGSRIFEKMHLKKSLPSLIPEIGKKSEGMGVLTVTITKGHGTAKWHQYLDPARREDPGKRHNHRTGNCRIQIEVWEIRLYCQGSLPEYDYVLYYLR